MLLVAGGLLACGAPPPPPSRRRDGIAHFETLREGPNAQPVQDRFPELHQEAEGHYRAALKAYDEERDVEAAGHHATMADLVWRTAVVRSQQRDHEAAAQAAQHQAARADQDAQAAQHRIDVAQDGIARQKRLNEMQTRLADAERNTRRERRAGKAKTQLDAAAAKINAAEHLDAARHAPVPMAEAQAKLTAALDAFEGGNYPEADQTAQDAWRAAETAIGVSQPKYDAEQAARALAARLANLVESGSQITGAEAHLEARGVVIRMRGLFPSGKSELTEEGQLTVSGVAKLVAAHPDLRILVEGHTDNRGRTAKNLTLSEERAKAVLGRLKGGGATGTLTALGRGDEAPVADNSIKAGRAANRRVDVVLLRP
jgi:outer membrane protein OmpA-like peptidoglycan-associated protein